MELRDFWRNNPAPEREGVELTMVGHCRVAQRRAPDDAGRYVAFTLLPTEKYLKQHFLRNTKKRGNLDLKFHWFDMLVNSDEKRLENLLVKPLMDGFYCGLAFHEKHEGDDEDGMMVGASKRVTCLQILKLELNRPANL
jgi:hypothetical protein